VAEDAVQYEPVSDQIPNKYSGKVVGILHYFGPEMRVSGPNRQAQSKACSLNSLQELVGIFGPQKAD